MLLPGIYIYREGGCYSLIWERRMLLSDIYNIYKHDS